MFILSIETLENLYSVKGWAPVYRSVEGGRLSTILNNPPAKETLAARINATVVVLRHSFVRFSEQE